MKIVGWVRKGVVFYFYFVFLRKDFFILRGQERCLTFSRSRFRFNLTLFLQKWIDKEEHINIKLQNYASCVHHVFYQKQETIIMCIHDHDVIV